MVEINLTVRMIFLLIGLVFAVLGSFILASYRRLIKIFAGAVLLGIGILAILIGFGLLKFGF